MLPPRPSLWQGPVRPENFLRLVWMTNKGHSEIWLDDPGARLGSINLGLPWLSTTLPCVTTELDNPKTSNAAELEQLKISLSQQPSKDSKRKYSAVAEKGHFLREALTFLLPRGVVPTP